MLVMCNLLNVFNEINNVTPLSIKNKHQVIFVSVTLSIKWFCMVITLIVVDVAKY